MDWKFEKYADYGPEKGLLNSGRDLYASNDTVLISIWNSRSVCCTECTLWICI